MKNKRNKNLKERGITLIALIVTIVVLLILASVTITLMFGDNNIFKLAKEAGDKTNEAIKSEQSQIDELNKWLTENGYGSENGGPTGGEENPETPKLEVGSNVTYNLVGDEYTWNKEYATSDETGTVTLSSKTGGEFRLTDWKVLAINENTKEITLVPKAPTTGKVRLHGAQGYNNAVKLLNDACSKLYGNTSNVITARSIKIEDIEGLMIETALTEARNSARYGERMSVITPNHNNYPVIYEQEKLSVIDENIQENIQENMLDLSDSPNYFIERSEGTSTTSNIGAITSKIDIRPYQTFWSKDDEFMQTAFKSYKEDSYYSLIIPNGVSSEYWVASRFVDTDGSNPTFGVNCIKNGKRGKQWDICHLWQ